jgi:AcrR family transcriptional regulator
MKSLPSLTEPRRAYRQGARAQSAAQTAETIIDVFLRHMETHWYDDISLATVAKDAGVTVPTILRHFGSKEGMLEATSKRFEGEVLIRRQVATGDIDKIIEALLSDYESSGDFMMRFLAQETRSPALKSMTDLGRSQHRMWVRQSFAPYFDGLTPEQEAWRLDALIMALDLYVWQVWRRERGRSPEEVARFMRTLVDAILDPKTGS